MYEGPNANRRFASRELADSVGVAVRLYVGHVPRSRA